MLHFQCLAYHYYYNIHPLVIRLYAYLNKREEKRKDFSIVELAADWTRGFILLHTPCRNGCFFLFFWYSLTWLLMLTKHRDSLCKERILHALVVVWEWNIKYFGVMYNGAVCRNQYWMNDFSFLSGWLVVSSLKKWDEDQYERWRSPKSSFEVKKTLLLSLQYVSKSYVYRSYFNVIASIKNWLRIGKNVFRIIIFLCNPGQQI